MSFVRRVVSLVLHERRMTHGVLIVGAGGHGRAVAEAVRQIAGLTIAGFLDDVRREDVWDCQVLGPTTVALETYRGVADAAIVAIGNNEHRQALQRRLIDAGFRMVTVVHPRALVSPTARVGHGCTIMAGAIVGTEAILEEGVIVNSGAAVDHHCHVEAYGHVGTNAAMAGGSVLGLGAWMQAGAALGYGVRVPPGDVLQPGEARAEPRQR